MSRMRQSSPQAFVAERLFRFFMRPIMHSRVPAGVQRLATDLMRFHPRPSEVKTDAFTLYGFTGERHQPQRRTDPRWAMLFLHGGGYLMGSPASHRNIASRLASSAGINVYVPQYRLAPENPYPAQLDDAEAAFMALLGMGFDASKIVVGGDSAGGNLTLALAQRLRDRGVTLPAALVLISPWTDATLSQLPEHDSDALLPKAWTRSIRPGFVSDALLSDPKVSPVLADFSAFPPTLIQSASAELLANDAQRLHQAMNNAGVAVTWTEYPGLWHDFQLIAGSVPEATQAVAEIGEFIKQRIRAH